MSLAPALFRTEHTEHLPSPSEHTTAPITHRARATRARSLATRAHAHTRTPAQHLRRSRQRLPRWDGKGRPRSRLKWCDPRSAGSRREEPRRLAAACGRETAAVTIHGQPVGIFRWEPEYSNPLPEYVAGPLSWLVAPAEYFGGFPEYSFKTCEIFRWLGREWNVWNIPKGTRALGGITIVRAQEALREKVFQKVRP